MENPMTVLKPLTGLVVIDEAQRMPGLFPVLRVLADREDNPATFLILGSASPELSRQASESLAGRVELIEMRGFDQSEVGEDSLDPLWRAGLLASLDGGGRFGRRQALAGGKRQA